MTSFAGSIWSDSPGCLIAAASEINSSLFFKSGLERHVDVIALRNSGLLSLGGTAACRIVLFGRKGYSKHPEA